MNNNNQMTFLQYAFRVYKGLLIALFIGLLVMAAVILSAWEYEGYERNTTLQIFGGILLVVYGISAFKIVQSYRDYLKGNGR